MLSICYNLIVKRISERDNMSKEESKDVSEMSYEELIAMRNRDVMNSVDQSQSILKMIQQVQDEDVQDAD
jgi:hypothetical protein|tara:strand:+ start:5521 stop:5730 length:210 start_codon:yes stop_codon:yes gene_type:complete